ncbi:site-specific DNA-methyltransferase [bacterium]|nr:MAG: site-specific DNA-methyltransferase [bacterium]
MAQIETVLPDLPTFHRFHLFDSTQIDFLNNKSVHLILTSPPYWNLKEYNKSDRQLGNIANFESFLDELNRVWEICFGVLVPGGRLICVVGDVCLSRRKNNGRHSVIPLHASIQEQCRKIGFDNLAPIIWSKIANAAFESDRGSTFLGKPYEPNAIIKNDIEFILMERKPGGYRSPSFTERLFSVISEENHKLWFNQIWTGITGASTNNHPAPFPVEFASRLIRMFSFVGDVVLDPFAGSGSTALAAWSTGRNSINVEIDPTYFDFAVDRFHDTSGRMLVNHVVEIHR